MANQDLSALIKDMDAMNEAIMINLSGGSGDRIKGQIENVNAHYPNRFGVFANVNFEQLMKNNILGIDFTHLCVNHDNFIS